MKTACQAIIALLVVVAFFRSLYQDFYGIKAREPWGVRGVIITCILTLLIAAMYWYAGAFSNLVGAP